MAGEHIFRCVVCGRIKGEANKWFVGTVVTKTLGAPFSGYLVGPWDSGAALLQEVEALCGDTCRQKRELAIVRPEMKDAESLDEVTIVD